MKKLLALLCALALCLTGVALAEEGWDEEGETPYYQLGDAMEDFTFTTYDGQTVTLSALLQEKDMVLLNLWATWCGPCEMEFPSMEAAYEAHSDRVAIVALSVEPDDTDDILAAYVSSHAMTFYVGHDEFDFMDKFAQEGIPTSVIIDRNGVICFIDCGAMTDQSLFEMLFEPFLGEDYSEPVLLTETPRLRPTVEAQNPAELSAALETSTVLNPEDEYTWPMVTAEVDGRTVVTPSNKGVIIETESELSIPLSASAGDAIAVTAKLDTEAIFDCLILRVNGERVKAFSGEMGWFTYAIPVQADGDLVLTLTYSRESASDYEGSEEIVCIDSVAVLTGDEAAAALAANPTYPVSDTISITPVNESAREVVTNDPITMDYLFGDAKFYIIPGGQADFAVTINSSVDPDVDPLYCDYNGNITLLRDAFHDGIFTTSSGIDSVTETGYSYTCQYLYWNNLEEMTSVIYFADEENANYFFSVELAAYTEDLTWNYADGTAFATDVIPDVVFEIPDEASYVVRYVDQDGNPVAGVVCQVCDDATCTVYTSDENGECHFTLEPYPWEIHTLRIPEGYEGDKETVTIASPYGEELEFILNRI
ncbi:MAG: TlpA family protein disulfide reductase [Clostridia bacterium]|nr:TlpA family protein disulfide reductase [Clostridia bacterium]